MLKLTESSNIDSPVDDVLSLPFADRQKTRQPAITKGGISVGLFLPRGQTLRAGLILTGSQGFKVRIEAAEELLSVVVCTDPLLFARACYHLGNRHLSLQILPGELRYQADHVIDDMVRGLGLIIEHQNLPFEPEGGAYAHGH